MGRGSEWLDDPSGIYDHRYFDGEVWTRRVALLGQELVDTVTEPTGLRPPADLPRPTLSPAAPTSAAAPKPPDLPATPQPPVVPGVEQHVSVPQAKPSRRRVLLAVALAVGLILVLALAGVLALVGAALDPTDVQAGDASTGNSSYDVLMADSCGVPGSVDYVTQAWCLLDLTGMGASGTDQRGLETVFKDACTVPDVPAADLAPRLGEGGTADQLAGLALLIRLARIHCGEGESLDHDGFQEGFVPPAGGAKPPPDLLTAADRQYLDLVIASYPPAAEADLLDTIALGEQVCENLRDGTPVDVIIEAGSEQRHFMFAIVTAANAAYCPDVSPVG